MPEDGIAVHELMRPAFRRRGWAKRHGPQTQTAQRGLQGSHLFQFCMRFFQQDRSQSEVFRKELPEENEPVPASPPSSFSAIVLGALSWQNLCCGQELPFQHFCTSPFRPPSPPSWAAKEADLHRPFSQSQCLQQVSSNGCPHLLLARRVFPSSSTELFMLVRWHWIFGIVMGRFLDLRSCGGDQTPCTEGFMAWLSLLWGRTAWTLSLRPCVRDERIQSFFRGFLTWLNVSSFVGYTTGLSKVLKCLAMSQGIQSCSLTETLIRPALRSAERPSGMCLSFCQGTS